MLRVHVYVHDIQLSTKVLIEHINPAMWKLSSFTLEYKGKVHPRTGHKGPEE